MVNRIPIDEKDFKSMIGSQILQKFNEYWGSENSEDIKRFSLNSYVNKPIVEYCESRSIPVEGKSVLEFGCRLGSSFLSWLSMGCHEIVGMDIDGRGLELSNEIFVNLGHKNVSYRLNKINESLPIKENEFDIVSCNAVIEHLPPKLRKQYINQLSKSVKKGGYLLISDTPNRLWLKEGHTTGLWIINYLPFRLKCLIASMSKHWKGKINANEFDKWIRQGLQGSSYAEIFNNLCVGKWEINHDVRFKTEYLRAIIGSSKSRIKLIAKMPLVFFAFMLSKYLYLLHGYPSAAASPTLLVSLKKLA